MIKKLTVALIIAFLFRLFIIFCLPVRKFDDTIKRYHYTAINMLEGRGYSHFNAPPYPLSFYKPPVYALFLLTIYKVCGVNLEIVRIIQALLDSFACLILFFLLGIYFNQRISSFGLWLAAFCPITAVYTNLVNPESLALFFMVLSLFFISKAVILNKSYLFFCAGLSTILLGYLRLELFSFVIIFGTYLFVRQIKKDLKKLLFYILGVLVIMSPWVARNYYLTGKFIPLSAGGGMGFSVFYGTFDYANRDVISLDKFYKDNPDIESKIDEWYKVVLYRDSSVMEKINVDKKLMRTAIHIISAHPWRYLFGRISEIPHVWISLHADEFAFLNNQDLRLFHPDLNKIREYAKHKPAAVYILLAKYALLSTIIFYLFMAIKGLWLMRRNVLAISLFVLPLIYVQAFLFFIQISANFVVPYWPCLIFFSSIGLSRTFLKIEPKLRII